MIALRALLLTLLLATAGCATTTEVMATDPDAAMPGGPAPAAANDDGESVEAGSEPVAMAAAKPPVRDLDAQTMFALLVAEMAGYRNRFDVALGNYLDQARKTHDPGVAERAVRIAQYLNANEAALEAAQIWATAAPEDAKAQETAARLLIVAGRYDEALRHMESTLALQGDAGFDFLALNAQELDDTARSGILAAFDRMLAERPAHPQLRFGKAILLRQSGDLAAALEEVRDLPEIAPDYVQGHILRARLLHESGAGGEALKHLAVAVERFPGNPRVRQQYARILVEENRLKEAREQFLHLMNMHPQDADLRFSVALINMELEDYDAAAGLFRQLAASGNRVEESYYYLGTIAEKRGNMKEALDWYRKVPVDAESLIAQARIAELRAENDGLESMQAYVAELREQRPDLATDLTLLEIEILMERKAYPVALATADRAVGSAPEDVNLLYARAMVFEKLDDLEKMEADLLQILDMEPENAAALNALGYTLADRTTRYDEAYELIAKAYELKPGDPAITDSMGWVLYRLGNYQESLRLLREAFDQFPDHEVAAHLGEVLWVTGNQPEARRIWMEALEKTPDSELLKRVLERFQVQAR